MPIKRRVFLNFNCKSFHSINLLDVADIQTAALHWYDVGTHGRENDSSVFSNSSFGKAFNSRDLNIHPMRNIPGTSISTPLYFVREEAFPLKPNLMRPFQGETSISQKLYSTANFLVYGEQLDALLAYWLNISVFFKSQLKQTWKWQSVQSKVHVLSTTIPGMLTSP